MTPAEAAFWHRVQRRVAGLEPEIARAILRAFETIRRELTDSDFAAFIARPDPLGALELLPEPLLDRAFSPLRQTLYQQTVNAVAYFGKDIGRELNIGFDVLNPRMLTAIRTLDTKVVEGLKAEVRATLVQVVERGLIDGVNPRVIARELRSAIGLGASQEQEVQNFRRALEKGDIAKALGYKKRDKRFDGSIKKGTLTREQIDKYVDIYRKRRIAQNAETNARTAALDAQKQAQHLAWESAIERGVVTREALLKRWVGTLDTRERPTHLAMEGETVGYDELFSNDQMLPGDTEYNCRCLARYSTRIQRQPARGVTGDLASALRARQAVSL